MICRYISVLAIVAMSLTPACSTKNSPELVAEAQKLADAYCDCAKAAVQSPAVLADTGKVPCRAEFDAAIGVKWTTPTGEDPAAGKVDDYLQTCFKTLSGARREAAYGGGR